MKVTKWELVVFVMLMLVCSAGFSDADELKVGFSFAKPPFIMAAQPFEDRFYDVNNEGLGLEIDIFKAALAVTGNHTFVPVYVPYNRLAHELENGTIDAAATVRADFPERFYSEEFVYFHNFAISTADANLTLETVDDVKTVSLVAWQGAKFDLGKEFEATVADNQKYFEQGDQQKQVLMFLNERVQVIVIDRNIFKWWLKELQSDIAVTYHDLFPEKTSFLVGFVSEEIRDVFDKGLAEIKSNGTYDSIIASYVE